MADYDTPRIIFVQGSHESDLTGMTSQIDLRLDIFRIETYHPDPTDAEWTCVTMYSGAVYRILMAADTLDELMADVISAKTVLFT